MLGDQAIVVVVVLGGIVGYVVSKRKKKAAAEEGADEGEDAKKEEGSTDEPGIEKKQSAVQKAKEKSQVYIKIYQEFVAEKARASPPSPRCPRSLPSLTRWRECSTERHAGVTAYAQQSDGRC